MGCGLQEFGRVLSEGGNGELLTVAGNSNGALQVGAVQGGALLLEAGKHAGIG